MYYGNEVLNRVSFLREDTEFISKSLFHPSTRFIFFNKQNPLVHKNFPNMLAIMTNGDNQICVDQIEPGQSNNIGYIGNLQFLPRGLMNHVSHWKEILHTWSEDNKNMNKELRSPGSQLFCLWDFLMNLWGWISTH